MRRSVSPCLILTTYMVGRQLVRAQSERLELLSAGYSLLNLLSSPRGLWLLPSETLLRPSLPRGSVAFCGSTCCTCRSQACQDSSKACTRTRQLRSSQPLRQVPVRLSRGGLLVLLVRATGLRSEGIICKEPRPGFFADPRPRASPRPLLERRAASPGEARGCGLSWRGPRLLSLLERPAAAAQPRRSRVRRRAAAAPRRQPRAQPRALRSGRTAVRRRPRLPLGAAATSSPPARAASPTSGLPGRPSCCACPLERTAPSGAL